MKEGIGNTNGNTNARAFKDGKGKSKDGRGSQFSIGEIGLVQ